MFKIASDSGYSALKLLTKGIDEKGDEAASEHRQLLDEFERLNTVLTSAASSTLKFHGKHLLEYKGVVKLPQSELKTANAMAAAKQLEGGDTVLGFGLLFEFCDGGSLEDEIEARKGSDARFSRSALLDLASQLLQGTADLECAKLFHSDIALRNIAFKKPDAVTELKAATAKIIDFGLVKNVANSSKASNRRLPCMEQYPGLNIFAQTAPKFDYSPVYDQYSVGVCLIQAATLHRYDQDPTADAILGNDAKCRDRLRDDIKSVVNLYGQDVVDQIIELINLKVSDKPVQSSEQFLEKFEKLKGLSPVLFLDLISVTEPYLYWKRAALFVWFFAFWALFGTAMTYASEKKDLEFRVEILLGCEYLIIALCLITLWSFVRVRGAENGTRCARFKAVTVGLLESTFWPIDNTKRFSPDKLLLALLWLALVASNCWQLACKE